MFRGTTVVLLPVNVMAIAVLSRDTTILVDQKRLVTLLMICIYGAGGALFVRRWCAAVHERLGRVLAPALLFVNAVLVVATLW